MSQNVTSSMKSPARSEDDWEIVEESGTIIAEDRNNHQSSNRINKNHSYNNESENENNESDEEYNSEPEEEEHVVSKPHPVILPTGFSYRDAVLSSKRINQRPQIINTIQSNKRNTEWKPQFNVKSVSTKRIDREYGDIRQGYIDNGRLLHAFKIRLVFHYLKLNSFNMSHETH